MSTVKDNNDPQKTRTIEVRLTVPKVGWLEATIKKIARPFKNRWVRIGTVAGIVVVASFFVTLQILSGANANENAATKEGADGVSEQDKKATTPYYATLLPGTKSIEELGGWTRASPTDRNAAFAFTDYIGNNRITVTQQPLPADFKDDLAFKIEELAKNYKASEKITVDSLVVHIANSAKGPQSVIFAKDGLLVLARSSVKISNDKWIGYIETLGIPKE